MDVRIRSSAAAARGRCKFHFLLIAAPGQQSWWQLSFHTSCIMIALVHTPTTKLRTPHVAREK
jgi:hypothetical protein